MTDDLKTQRDRYIAFSLAAADLLIEVDADLKVIKTIGAAKALLGEQATGLTGRDVCKLFVDSDQSFARRLLGKSRTVGRIEPCSLHLKPVGARPLLVNMGACFLPGESDHTFITVTVLSDTMILTPEPRDGETGLLTSEGYQKLATRILSDEASKAPGEMKMVRMKGLFGVVRSLPHDQACQLLNEIGSVLRAQAMGGFAAARLSDDSFSYMPLNTADPVSNKALTSEIQAVAKAAGLTASSLNPSIMSLELTTGGLDRESIARALTYALNDLCKGHSDKPCTLAECLNLAMAETVKQFGNIRQLIETKSFTLNFQPVVNLQTRELHHYEALMRFPDGRKPYETIRLSEQLGLVPAFDLAICQKALDALIQHPQAHIAVNVSGMSLENAGFREDLRKLLMPFSGIQDRLMFELTESSEIKDMEAAASYLRWLRRTGYRVCLDDFGAGAAAYSYLRHFEVDFVKIDGSFIKEAQQNERQLALLRSVSKLCHELKSEVVAEMIEDETTAKMCAGLGIGLGQGYLFGKPKPQIDAPKESIARRKGFKESWG